HIFVSDDFFEERMQHEVLIEYFTAVQNAYSVEWDNKAFLLCKYVGVSAMLTLLERIIDDLRAKHVVISDANGLQISQENFKPYIKKLRPFSFNSAEEKEKGMSYVGEGGVNELTKRLIAQIFGGANAKDN